MKKQLTTINIYGMVIRCEIPSPDLARELTRPFNYFIGKPAEQNQAEILITIKQTEPPYKDFPAIPASFSTPRNIVYKDGTCKVIDYFGKGVVHQDERQSQYIIYSTDKNFLQETFYLVVISLFGQYCDSHGLLRVHALALSYQDTAILLPLPPGGGKSTMALSILAEKNFNLISDDEPVIDKSGYIHPFPIRIGTLDKQMLKTIPAEFVYTIDRMEFGIKYFIDIACWAARLERRALKKSILFVSKRMLNGPPSIKRTSKVRVFKALIRDSVIGVGLFQGLEFILNNSPWEVLLKFHTVAKRFVAALKLTIRSEAFQMTLSRDIPRNTEIFKKFIQEHVGTNDHN